MTDYFKYQDLISIKNLFQAWNEFKKGKRSKSDVRIFESELEDNIFLLQRSLMNESYEHGSYQSFYVFDPKFRHIHKSLVRDRIIHHLLYKYLYSIWDKTFIFDSYSCRLGKGTHRAVKRLADLIRKVSNNNTLVCYSLKCDINKFFDSVDHKILFRILKTKVKDKKILTLFYKIIYSFDSKKGIKKGIPLGNLTSQIFANIYLNDLDQFIKHRLKVKYYIRYVDDFIILSCNKKYLYKLITEIDSFLNKKLKLSLNNRKTNIRKYSCGVDFLGYTILPFVILPKGKTKKRIIHKMKSKLNQHILGKVSNYSLNQSLQSYLGFLKHANAYKLSIYLKDIVCRD